MNNEEKTAFGAFLTNIFLFLLKVSAAIPSGSLALLSSAFDSLNDVVSYLIGYYSIRESARGPDRDHPFGHRRMQPLAAIVIAIFAAILSFEILRFTVISFLSGVSLFEITTYTFLVLVITIVVKLIMYFFLKNASKKNLSSAIDAMMVDSKNDILFNSIAIVGVSGAYFGQPFLDEAAAVIIAAYIAYSGYEVARKNFNYIVGAKPDKKIIDTIAKKARKVNGVKKLGLMRAHYVGDRVHVELAILVEKETKGLKSHEIALNVQHAIESLQIVERAFIHVDYG
ncbi:cation diffusion facilitator family transporter [Candidatus Micrarchaeota archaeon]|nr:cation diffusion facilitator family transporter [Candidatus Micrarchaeota archaeon]